MPFLKVQNINAVYSSTHGLAIYGSIDTIVDCLSDGVWCDILCAITSVFAVAHIIGLSLQFQAN